MRHYFSYDADGNIVGMHTHAFHATKLGGWPESHKLGTPDACTPEVKAFRDSLLASVEGAVDFIEYSCPCSPLQTVCNCVSTGRLRLRVSLPDKTLVERKTGAFLLDGTPVADGDTVSRAPGTVVALKVASVGAADASKVLVYERGGASIMEATEPFELTFTAGETPTFNITAPAQGLIGRVGAVGADMQPVEMILRGWA